jgi:Putative transposase
MEISLPSGRPAGSGGHSFLRQLYQQDWVVYAKPPFGGAEHVLNYLAR